MSKMPNPEEALSKPGWFYRVTGVLFLGFLASIIITTLKLGPTPFVITNGVIFILLIMLILVVSEIFSSISLGKIIHLNREVNRAETEKREVKIENRELRTSLVNLATTFSQSQVTNNFTGIDPLTLRRAFGVVDAEPEEKEENIPITPAVDQVTAPGLRNVEDYVMNRKVKGLLKEDMLRRFCERYSIASTELRRDVKFELGLESFDPIMSRPFVYDGYVKTEKKEYFMDGTITFSLSIMASYKLYVSLAKVLFYRQLKKIEAELVILEPQIPDEDWSSSRQGRLIEWFQPALSNNLLRVESFPYTLGEFSIIKDRARQLANKEEE